MLPPGSNITFKYNPHQMTPADVLDTFVGREDLLERMVAHLRARRGGSGVRHLFLHGPRGIGKTTLLLALRYTIEADPGLREAFDVVQFSEEERRIINLTSFSVRVLELLAEARKDRADDPVRARLEEARAQPARAFDLLLAAAGQLGSKQVVFLVDNFDDLAEAVVSRKKGTAGPDPEQALATFLSYPAFHLVATSLQAPEKRGSFPRALLECFEPPVRIEPLTDPVAFLRRRAVRDRREGFLDELPRLAGRIEGLNRLADGNPRLLVFLYDCLGDRRVPDLVEIVQRTVDNLTPMYQDVLDRLVNRGQAAVLEMLASRGGVGRTREIAELTFQDEQTVRTALGNLCDLGLAVRPDQLRLPGQEGDGASRETVFRTYPPLFQIWYEMRHLKREESLYLVHFFSLLTDAEEARRLLSEGVGAPIEVRRLIESVVEVLDPISEKIRDEHVIRILSRGGTLRDALASLDRALEAAPVGVPEQVGLFLVRSGVRRDLGDLQGAEIDLNAAEAALGPGASPEQRVKILVVRAELSCSAGDGRTARDLAQDALDLCDGLRSASAPDLRVYALVVLARSQFLLNETQLALATAESAGEHLNAGTSLSIQGVLASLRGSIREALGRLEDAKADFEKALDIALIRNALLQEATVRTRLGSLLRARGNPTQAEEQIERALAIARTVFYPSAEAGSLIELGLLHEAKGDLQKARENIESALMIYRNIGSHAGILQSLGSLGGVYFHQGEVDRARISWEEGLALSRTLGSKSHEASYLSNLGTLHNNNGEKEKARELYFQSLPIIREIGDRFNEAVILNNLAKASSGDMVEDLLKEGLAIFRETGFVANEAVVLTNLGRHLLGQKRYSAAKKHLVAALGIAEAIGEVSSQARIHSSFGLLAWAEGRRTEALDYVSKAYITFQRLGMLPELQETALQWVSALLQIAADHLRRSEILAAEGRFLEALAKSEACGTSKFVVLLANDLVVPCLRDLPEIAPTLLKLLDPVRKQPAFSEPEPAANLRVLEALLRFYTGGRSTAEFRDLGPAEITVIQSLIDRVDRPVHSEARALLQGRDFDAARKLLEEILARSPDDVEALLNLASALIEQEDFAGAERQLDRALARHPDLPHATFLLALVKERQGETERAMALFRQCVEAPNPAPQAFPHLARLLGSAGRFAELAEVLRQWRGLEGSDGDLDAWIPVADLLAGDVDRARASLPPEGFVPEEPGLRSLLGLLRVLLALASGEHEAARRHSGALLQLVSSLPPGASADSVSPRLLESARGLLGERELRLFIQLVQAVRQQAAPELLDADLLDEKDREELARRIAEEGRLTLEALRQGRVHRLADLFELSTRSLGPRAGLVALGEAWPDLEPGEQRVALEILAEAAAQGGPLEAAAALGALGRTFARLEEDGRARSLEAILTLAEKEEAEIALRERAASLLNVLYPNLTPGERRTVQARLEALRSRMQSPALGEIFRDTIPAVERKSAE